MAAVRRRRRISCKTSWMKHTIDSKGSSGARKYLALSHPSGLVWLLRLQWGVRDAVLVCLHVCVQVSVVHMYAWIHSDAIWAKIFKKDGSTKFTTKAYCGRVVTEFLQRCLADASLHSAHYPDPHHELCLVSSLVPLSLIFGKLVCSP